MDIIEKVIDMCEDAEVLQPEDDTKTVLTQIKPAGRIHAVFGEDREMFIAFTDNLRDLFAGNFYLGGVMIDRYDNGYAVRHFFIEANNIKLNGSGEGDLITPFDDDGGPTDLIWNIGDHDRLPRAAVEYNYREIMDMPLEEFEQNWIRTSQLKVEIKYNARGDGFTF